ANDWGAHLFLSIHINAGGGDGFESYIYNGQVPSQTVFLQNTIHNEIISATDFNNRDRKRANFQVLRGTKMAALLTENGFIDHEPNAKKLKQASFLNKIARGHTNGT